MILLKLEVNMANQPLRGSNYLRSKINETIKLSNNAGKYILSGIGLFILWRIGIMLIRINYVILPFLSVFCIGFGIYWLIVGPKKIRELEDELSHISKE